MFFKIYVMFTLRRLFFYCTINLPLITSVILCVAVKIFFIFLIISFSQKVKYELNFGFGEAS